MSGYGLSETERLVANLVRVGVISALDVANARVKCAVGGLSTDWLPWLTGRAGATRTWSAPRVGEQVLVLSPYGDPAQGVVLPAIYQDAHPAPASSQDVDTIVFPDGTVFEYDSAANKYTQTIQGAGNWTFNCQVANINAATSVTLDTPDTNVKGRLTVDGLLTYKDGIAGSGGGNGNSISGSMNITGGDVIADDIGLKSHHHIEQGDGAPTSAAQA